MYKGRARELAFLCGFFCFMDHDTLSAIVRNRCGTIFLSGLMPIPASSSFDVCFDIFQLFLTEYREALLDFVDPCETSAGNCAIGQQLRGRDRGSLLKKVLRQFYDAREFPLNEIDLEQKINIWFYWKVHLEDRHIYTPLDRFLQFLFSTPVPVLKEGYIPHEFLRIFYNNGDDYFEERFLERTLRAREMSYDSRRGFEQWEEKLVECGTYTRYEKEPPKTDRKTTLTTRPLDENTDNKQRNEVDASRKESHDHDTPKLFKIRASCIF